MKTLYILLVIVSLFNLIKAGFDVTIEGKKLVYVGTKVDKFLTSIVLSDKSCPTVKILFTCTRKGKDGCICKSTDLDFTKLIGSTVTFNGKLMDGKDKNTEHKMIGIPNPPPRDLKFNPSTEPGLSLVSGNFLRFGYDVKTLNVIIGGKTKKLNLEPPIPKDATKFTVKNLGGSGSFSIQLGNSIFKLNFALPSIQRIESSNGQFKITGSNFYTDKKLVKIAIGSETLPASSIVSVSNGLIVFNYEPILTQYSPIKVEVNGLSSSISQLKFTPLPISINSVPEIGGVVTITGKCLKGALGDKSKTTINIGSYLCETISQTPSEITCKLPPSTEKGGIKKLKVSIDIDNISNTNSLQYSYGIPKVSNIKQNGIKFTIEGTSLGTMEISKITVIDQNKEENTISPDEDDDNEQRFLVFTLPSKIFSGSFVVTHNEDVSNKLDFTTTPILTGPLTLAPTEGGLFEMSGFYLNPSGVKPTIQIENTGKTNPIECIDVTQAIDGSKLSCTLSYGTGNKMVAVVTFGADQPYRIVFSYQPPSELEAIQKENIIEIKGRNLGSDTSLVELILNNGSIKADSLENGIASFTLPETAQSDNNAIIIVDGLPSEPNAFNIAILPVCKSISSINTEGGSVSIVGSFFDSKSAITVMISDKPCESVTISSSTTLECIAPKGSGTNNTVILTVGDVQVPSLLNLSYNPPTILSTNKVDQIKGGNVTIIGTNFAENQSNSVTINSRDCNNIVVVDSNKIECYLEPLIVTKDTITSDPDSKSFINVTINGQSFGDTIFEWSPPETETPLEIISSSPEVVPSSSESISPSLSPSSFSSVSPSSSPSTKSNSTLKPKPTTIPNLNSNKTNTNNNNNDNQTEHDENNHSTGFKIYQSFSLVLFSILFILFV
ncbi:hypothetical protein ACTFIV_008897 [Dictyostelium citrinum]